MKRLMQLLLLVIFLSGSIAVLAYVGLPYIPLSLTALRLNSYLYTGPEGLVADFEAEPTGGLTPLAVAFTNTSIGDYSENLWDFGDGRTSTLDDPLHLYLSADAYTVTLTISGTLGTDTITKTNYIKAFEPLEADFSAEPTSGLGPLEVNFSNLSEGEFTACKWDFGDGESSAACQEPMHTFTSTGLYTVTLTISNTVDVDSLTRVDFINVFAVLEADFRAEPTIGLRPLQVTFANLSAGDYDSCAWDFGDGKSSTRCDPQNTYNTKGVYSVTLTISGPAGEDAITKANYISIFEPIIAQFKGTPTSGVSPLEVTFTNSSSGDYEVCSWDFGDFVTSHACNDVVHTYTTSGIYAVSLTVSSPLDSDKRTKEAYISVYEPVNADFRASPLSGPVPLKVSFTDLSTGDYNNCAWNFGDNKTSSKCNPRHTYTHSGIYTVTLTVSGDGGTDTVVRQQFVDVELGLYYLPVIIIDHSAGDASFLSPTMPRFLPARDDGPFSDQQSRP